MRLAVIFGIVLCQACAQDRACLREVTPLQAGIVSGLHSRVRLEQKTNLGQICSLIEEQNGIKVVFAPDLAEVLDQEIGPFGSPISVHSLICLSLNRTRFSQSFVVEEDKDGIIFVGLDRVRRSFGPCR